LFFVLVWLKEMKRSAQDIRAFQPNPKRPGIPLVDLFRQVLLQQQMSDSDDSDGEINFEELQADMDYFRHGFRPESSSDESEDEFETFIMETKHMEALDKQPKKTIALRDEDNSIERFCLEFVKFHTKPLIYLKALKELQQTDCQLIRLAHVGYFEFRSSIDGYSVGVCIGEKFHFLSAHCKCLTEEPRLFFCFHITLVLLLLEASCFSVASACTKINYDSNQIDFTRLNVVLDKLNHDQLKEILLKITLADSMNPKHLKRLISESTTDLSIAPSKPINLGKITINQWEKFKQDSRNRFTLAFNQSLIKAPETLAIPIVDCEYDQTSTYNIEERQNMLNRLLIRFDGMPCSKDEKSAEYTLSRLLLPLIDRAKSMFLSRRYYDSFENIGIYNQSNLCTCS
jgi:hypothetical protein